MSILSEFEIKAPELGVKNILILQNGEKIAEKHWDEEIRRNQYSVSKSFTCAAVGIAIHEHLLSLEEKICDAFPDEVPEEPNDFLKNLTVRHLLTMSIGQEKGHLMGTQRPFLETKDWVRYALCQPFSFMPGEKFVYSNVGPYLAGILVQRRAGCNLIDYLMPRLFVPLGILRPTWETDPEGNTFGAGGLFICVSELARFMQLYLQNGSWNGRQLLSAKWVRESAQKQMENGREGYGYLFWRGAGNSYRSDGKYGQYGIIVPDKQMVISINSECIRQNELLELIENTLFSKL